MSLRTQFRYLNPYDLHKLIINEYVLNKPGDTKHLGRDGGKDRTDSDVIRDNHKFLWDNKQPDTWEQQFAKKYYDKLFKEYCIGDLSLYKENKIALRWRIEKEVVVGKGQFICGNKRCNEELDLRTWEVNFAYKEDGEKKNALVKIRLCPECSSKLNYHSKKREVKRLKRSLNKSSTTNKKSERRSIDRSPRRDKNEASMDVSSENDIEMTESESSLASTSKLNVTNVSPWAQPVHVETKSREDEMDDYLQELLL